MALPGTLMSFSANTPCYNFNWYNNVGGGAQTIIYTDCNGVAGKTQSPGGSIGNSGNFCARSTNSPGGVSVDNVGNCNCNTWYSRIFNSGVGLNYTFAWLDCNGQPARKTITTTGGGIGQATFFSCSKSKPNVIIAGGAYDLDQRLEYDYCNRSVVG